MIDDEVARLRYLSHRLDEEWADVAPLWRDEPASRFHTFAVSPLIEAMNDLAAEASRFAELVRRARNTSRS